MQRLKGELEYIVDESLGSRGLADTIIMLRSTCNALFNCYTTSGRLHAMHMMRHLCGLTVTYFNRNLFTVDVRPQRPMNSYGRWLLTISSNINRAEESLVRGGIGDAKSALMDTIGACLGCFEEFGFEDRSGYEPKDS